AGRRSPGRSSPGRGEKPQPHRSPGNGLRTAWREKLILLMRTISPSRSKSAGEKDNPDNWRIARMLMRFDWRLLVWLLVLSFIFWSAFWAWSYRPAKAPIAIIKKQSEDPGAKP